MRADIKAMNKILKQFDASPAGISLQWKLELCTIICALLDEKQMGVDELAIDAGMSYEDAEAIVNADGDYTFDQVGRLLFALGIRIGDVKLVRSQS